MLFALLTFVHAVVCLVLILVVLLQTGKRADLAGAFGGGGSQTAFGARGAATFLSKATTISAVVFMVTSLALAMLSGPGQGGSTVLDDIPAAPAPAIPGASPSPAPGSPAPTPQDQGAAPTAPPASPEPSPPASPPPSPN